MIKISLAEKVMRKYTIFVFVILLLIACGSKDSQDAQSKDTAESKSAKVVAKSLTPQTISIYCYENFPKSEAMKLERRLKEFFPNVVLKEQSLSLPSKHYNKERNRYRGTGLFEELSKHRDGDAVIGLTDNIIFQANEISSTFGIMGVSPVGTYKCVVSSKLPKSGGRQTDENFCKLALHELGHAFGLYHCPNQNCYMVDAEHKMKFPQTTGFCDSCRSRLNAKGWAIK